MKEFDMNNKAKNKKDHIMASALEIFGEKSFREVTISQIAERAGVATGTVYEYFNDKEDLYFSIPSQITEVFNEKLKLHLEGLCDPIEKIRKYIWFYLFFFENDPVYTELLLMELRGNPNFLNSKYYQGFRDATSLILEIIKEGQEQGRIRNDVSPLLLRHMILGPLEHVTTNWLILGKTRKLGSYTKEISLLVISALKPLEQGNQS